MEATVKRFEDKYIPEPNSGCFLWLRYLDSEGYGGFQINGRWDKAHRAAWTIAHGDIPHGLHVLHRCDNPCCVNIDHLFLGTQTDNNRDRDAKGRTNIEVALAVVHRNRKLQTHCKRGHLLSGENLRITGQGFRECKQCKLARNRDSRGQS